MCIISPCKNNNHSPIYFTCHGPCKVKVVKTFVGCGDHASGSSALRRFVTIWITWCGSLSWHMALPGCVLGANGFFVFVRHLFRATVPLNVALASTWTQEPKIQDFVWFLREGWLWRRSWLHGSKWPTTVRWEQPQRFVGGWLVLVWFELLPNHRWRLPPPRSNCPRFPLPLLPRGGGGCWVGTSFFVSACIYTRGPCEVSLSWFFLVNGGEGVWMASRAPFDWQWLLATMCHDLHWASSCSRGISAQNQLFFNVKFCCSGYQLWEAYRGQGGKLPDHSICRFIGQGHVRNSQPAPEVKESRSCI